MVQIGPKKLTLSHFEFFFVYIFLHSLSNTPGFCQMKDLFKIYICGKFHHWVIPQEKTNRGGGGGGLRIWNFQGY